jgi:hypothetical protein
MAASMSNIWLFIQAFVSIEQRDISIARQKPKANLESHFRQPHIATTLLFPQELAPAN